MDNIKALVEKIDALEKKATPGPWAWDQRGEKINEWALGVAFDVNDNPLVGRFDNEDAVYVEQVCQTEGATVNYADADLICALRNAWPELKAALAPLAEPAGMPGAYEISEAIESAEASGRTRDAAVMRGFRSALERSRLLNKFCNEEIGKLTARAEASEMDARFLRLLRDKTHDLCEKPSVPNDGELCIAEWDDDWSEWRPARNLDSALDAAGRSKE